jgi:hypothetical protein
MFGADVLSQQHNVSVTGGNEKTKFSLSSTYNYDGGLMENNDYCRYNFNFKLSHELDEHLKLDLNARISDAEINGSGTSGSTNKVRTSEAVTKGPMEGLDEFTEVDPNTLTDDEYEQWLRSNLPPVGKGCPILAQKIPQKLQLHGGGNKMKHCQMAQLQDRRRLPLWV